MRDTTRLERTAMVVHGDRCELRLGDGRITITKQATAQQRPVSVTVPVDQVRGATVDRPTRGQRGWLHLAVVGGSVPPASELAASTDPYAMPLSGREAATARRLVRLVADHVRRRGLPPELHDDRTAPSVVRVPPASRSTSPLGNDRSEPTPPLGNDRSEPTPAADQRASGGDDGQRTVGRADGPEPGAASPAHRTGPDGDDGPLPAPPDGTAANATELHLCELVDLHRAGVLTDDEYERARRRVVASGATR